MTKNTSFDSKRYKQSQKEQWNQDAAAWHRWGTTLQNWFGEVTELMLDRANLASSSRVLDIATGAGEPALSAAARLGPEGYVLATDLSENIVRFAQQVGKKQGITNLETRVMDGEDPDLPDDDFDVILCRFGLMFMPDRRKALSEWRRILKPDGRVVVAVFSTPDYNEWAAVPLSIIRQRAQLPTVLGELGLFCLGGQGVLQNALEEAGFRQIETQFLSTPMRMDSVEEYTRFARESLGSFNQMMSHLPKEERESIWDEVGEAMRQFESAEGLEVPCEPLVGLGIK